MRLDRRVIIAGLLGLLLSAQAAASSVVADVKVEFDPRNQAIPFPYDLLFEADVTRAEQLDGTLNIPVEDPNDSASAVPMALNTLDGFSTVGAWRVAFTGDVRPETLVGGETVRVFRMANDGGDYPARVRPHGVERELTPGEDYRLSYDPGQRALQIIPAKPLDYNTNYTVVITKGVEDTDGDKVGYMTPWLAARNLDKLDQCDEPVKEPQALLQCTTNRAIEPIEEDPAYDIGRYDMIMAWGITTQRMDSTFASAATFIENDGLKSLFNETEAECTTVICLVNLDEATGEEAPATPGGKAHILPGSIRLPYGIAEASDLAPGSPSNDFNPTPAEDDAPLHENWECQEGPCNSDDVRGNASGEAIIRNVQTAPVVMAVPDPSAGGVPEPTGDGYPVVIFQHAIKQNRSNALAVADRLAREGFAVVGIDMPLHGLVERNIENPALTDLYAPNFNFRLYDSAITSPCWIFCDGDIEWAKGMRDALPVTYERTQYLDLVGGSGDQSDGEIDGSGSHFLNPSQPLTQRDNLRQGALDLVALAHHLRNGDLSECGTRLFSDGFAGPDCGKEAALSLIDTSELHFVGHSVGNIVAAPFLSWDARIESVSMLAPVGGLMRALEGSETIGPQLRAGLADSGVVPGTEDYYRFFASVQAVIDSAEPINHAAAIGKGTNGGMRPVYLSQILGNDGSSGAGATPADLVLPPSVEGRPLAGSTPLLEAVGLNKAPSAADHPGSGSVTLGTGYHNGGVLQAALGFRFGTHASPLKPVTEDSDPREGDGATFPVYRGEQVHNEMQNQLADFLGRGGSRITVGDVTLVEARD